MGVHQPDQLTPLLEFLQFLMSVPLTSHALGFFPLLHLGRSRRREKNHQPPWLCVCVCVCPCH